MISWASSRTNIWCWQTSVISMQRILIVRFSLPYIRRLLITRKQVNYLWFQKNRALIHTLISWKALIILRMKVRVCLGSCTGRWRTSMWCFARRRANPIRMQRFTSRNRYCSTINLDLMMRISWMLKSRMQLIEMRTGMKKLIGSSIRLGLLMSLKFTLATFRNSLESMERRKWTFDKRRNALTRNCLLWDKSLKSPSFRPCLKLIKKPSKRRENSNNKGIRRNAWWKLQYGILLVDWGIGKRLIP